MMPDVSAALDGLMSPASVLRVTKAVANHEVIETLASAEAFEGLFAPMPAHKLMVKPEGQRSFKWWTLTTPKTLALDDIVQDHDGRQFRVMAVADWGQAGFFVYDLTERVS